MKSKLIVHLIFSFTTGGAENLVIDLVNEQVLNNEVHLIIVNKHYNVELFKQVHPDVKLHLIDRKNGTKNPFGLVVLNILIRRINPNVIHCHNHNLISALIGLKHKCLLTIHDVKYPTNKLKHFKGLIAISEAVKKDVEERSNHLLSPTVVYNAINVPSITKRNSFKIENEFRLVQISRLMHEKKGQDILVKALSIIINKYELKSIVLDFIGDGESKDYLLNLIKLNKLDSYINFIHNKNREWIYKNLHNYHLLVQPSRYEGFGLTIIEAMAANIPVVVSALDGPLEILRNGEYGLIFKSDDEFELAEKIIHQIKSYNSDEVKLKCATAFEYCNENFSIGKMVSAYYKEYSLITN